MKASLEQQKIWFEKLRDIRTYLADALELSAASGVQDSVVEKYSDQAHFIYELLQNADDAGATYVGFELDKERLVFKHNGTERFTVSEPDTTENRIIEKLDKVKGKLGHINSICSIGNSSKNIEANTIGKFGVGFKAVFQYTDTPHIYDPTFKFKIERFIIPVALEEDFNGRETDETVFCFPFDNTQMLPDRAYNDINEKLQSLIYPTLFLRNLRRVSWKSESESGGYYKEISNSNWKGDIYYEKVKTLQVIGDNKRYEKLFLFSRTIHDSTQKYSVVFFLDENDKLLPTQHTTFCFFPTKETTHLNFIIHAPFLLTDSRETIKRNDDHNNNMIHRSAELAADSLCILRDLNLIDDNTIKDIVPYDESNFYKRNYYGPDEELLFAPFFDKIKEKFRTENLLPAKDGYIASECAYWPQDSPVLSLFSDIQLAQLTQNDSAKWVFRSLVRNQADSSLKDYIDGCIKDHFDIRALLNKIDVEFIEQQSDEWLHQFYYYLDKNRNYWEAIKTKPIFLNQNKRAVPAYEKKSGEYINTLFYPSKYVNNPNKTIYSDLIKNETTKLFIASIGIKEASLKDEIFNNIVPLYEIGENMDYEEHFKIFFKYYIECNKNEEEVLLNVLKDTLFISCKYSNGEERRAIGRIIYYPTSELKSYFKNSPKTLFLDEDLYLNLIDESEKEYYKTFFNSLGVSDKPRVEKKITKDYDNIDIIRTYNLNEGIHIHNRMYDFTTKITDFVIDGLDEALQDINLENSLYIWNFVSTISDKYVASFEYAVHTYKEARKKIDSNIIRVLNGSKCLFTKNGIMVSPSEVTYEDLSDKYDIKSPNAKHLIDHLDFIPLVELTEDQDLIKFLEDNNMKNKSDLEEFIKWRNQKTQNTSRYNYPKKEHSDSKHIESSPSDLLESLEDYINTIQENKAGKVASSKPIEYRSKLEYDYDSDEEFEKAYEELKTNIDVKKNRAELAQMINESTEYSYDWFKYYIQLLTSFTEKQDAQKQKSISFQEINAYKSDNKYFILKGANNYIPSDIESAEDFKVTLVFGNGKRENIKVEGVSKKGQDLLIYCPDSLPKSILSSLSDVLRADIKFTPIIDLLDRLYRSFSNESYIDSWEDFEEAFPALHYVYGPPGTGKTTTICRNIDEILKDNPEGKILVLTPTNKAADVVSKKLVEIDSSIAVKRLSHPTDPELEESIYIDILDSDQINSINVLASTIHRLPYFSILGEGLLFQYDWDYVIFDEASMTGLHYIVFAIMALYKYNPDIKFIVSGDPKQIPPVLEVNDKILEEIDFQEENIYKMMNLNSFKPEEQSLRDIDTIENLTTQYRSVHHIGQLYSEFSYSNLLKHNRLEKTNDAKKQLPDKFKKIISSAVTFIDIPLDRNNSIYGVNRLFYSSYHIYSAILVAEIIKYFDSVNDSGESWSIGLVSPYKAQAVLMSKLLASYGLSENISVLADTVHGFQGDECDIVFFVCNPNGYSYSGNKKALLSKEYIYNVAISRARDYLVVLHPFSSIKNNDYINQLSVYYNKNFGKPSVTNAHKIQKEIFYNTHFIENNSFISGHDNVNVFGITDMKYFIKSSESAIDIQLRDIGTNKNDTLSLNNKSENSEETTIKNEENGDIYRPTEVKLQGLKILGKIEL